ncbi:MAG: MerR family transcriptional regulator [Paracoccaceae bacterium]
MQKSPYAFRTISEVSDVLGIPAHVLRFWESKFVQIKPVKRGGGRRYYRPDDVSLIRAIQNLLHEQGMTIKGAQRILRERGIKATVVMGAELLADTSGIEQPNIIAQRQRNAPIAAIYSRLQTLRQSIVNQILELA